MEKLKCGSVCASCYSPAWSLPWDSLKLKCTLNTAAVASTKWPEFEVGGAEQAVCHVGIWRRNTLHCSDIPDEDIYDIVALQEDDHEEIYEDLCSLQRRSSGLLLQVSHDALLPSHNAVPKGMKQAVVGTPPGNAACCVVLILYYIPIAFWPCWYR